MKTKHIFINEQTNAQKHDLASDDCQVGDWSRWGECFGNVCGGSGKQYRQRYYKTPDKSTKCQRKLFETRSCMMSLCTYGIMKWNNVFACLLSAPKFYRMIVLVSVFSFTFYLILYLSFYNTSLPRSYNICSLISVFDSTLFLVSSLVVSLSLWFRSIASLIFSHIIDHYVFNSIKSDICRKWGEYCERSRVQKSNFIHKLEWMHAKL